MNLEPTGPDWVPQSCTLPTAEQPLRVAEFDHLFATALRRVERTSPTVLTLRLDGTARSAARDLAERETGCCSFFTFTFGGTDEVTLEVAVPPTRVDVLEALAERAAAAAGLSG